MEQNDKTEAISKYLNVLEANKDNKPFLMDALEYLIKDVIFGASLMYQLKQCKLGQLHIEQFSGTSTISKDNIKTHSFHFTWNVNELIKTSPTFLYELISNTLKNIK